MPAEAAFGDRAKLADEDVLRAQMYRLLSSFLTAVPSAHLLTAGASLEGDDSELGTAIGTFAQLCRQTDVGAAEREYHDLFIGVGRGELLPYASYYLTGFLHEKPLAKLRQDMEALGLQAPAEQTEPEDHVAAITEMMAGLIDGTLSAPLPLDRQKQIFEAHLHSWAPHFFRDLEGAKSSVLYAALGKIGREFLRIEAAAFSMTEAA